MRTVVDLSHGSGLVASEERLELGQEVFEGVPAVSLRKRVDKDQDSPGLSSPAIPTVPVPATPTVPVPAIPAVATVPVSVRNNPASYRPAYGGYSGYRAPPSSSGGYSAGK